jgi:hypothetical protein
MVIAERQIRGRRAIDRDGAAVFEMQVSRSAQTRAPAAANNPDLCNGRRHGLTRLFLDAHGFEQGAARIFRSGAPLMRAVFVARIDAPAIGLECPCAQFSISRSRAAERGGS